MSERRIAVVTGAAAGIGAAVARTLARDGYSLALLDRDDVELKRVTAELAETIVEGADIESHVVDVTDRQAVDAAVASTMDTFGRIDALAHVAGILDTGSVLDSDPDQWRKIFGVNVFGLLNVLQSVGLEMRRRRAGGDRGRLVERGRCPTYRDGCLRFVQSCCHHVGSNRWTGAGY